jgi:lysophospholipase L1-like esterase
MQEKQFAPDLKWIASLLVLGILSIVGAFALDWFGGAPGLGFTQIIFLVIGAVFIMMAFLFRRIAKLPFFPPIEKGITLVLKGLLNGYRILALLLLAPIVIFLLMEIGFRLMTPDASLFGRPDPNAALHQQYLLRAQTPYFNEQEWSAQMWEDTYQVSLTLVQAPYVGWDYPPFSSETVNVGADSLRVTPNSDCSSDAYKVYLFGGSTMWGYGVPDFATIPAYLQTVLDEALDRPVCVVNYGELAFNSTQEYITLLLQLRQGSIPDFVVFYDGANDTRNAFLNGEAGTPYNLSVVQQNSNPVTNPLLDVARRNSYLVNYFIARQPAPNTEDREVAADLDQQIVDNYLETTRMVESLAQVYGFQYTFIWQPVIVDCGKTLTAQEELQLNALGVPMTELYRSTYQLMAPIAAEEGDNLYSIATIDQWVNPPDGEMFIDSNHLLPPGNETIARTIASIILPQIESDTTGS